MGTYDLGRTDVTSSNVIEEIYMPVCRFTPPYNLAGTPPMSRPLAVRSSGRTIGVRIGAAPAQEHVLPQPGATLEKTLPWAGRVPPQFAGVRHG